MRSGGQPSADATGRIHAAVDHVGDGDRRRGRAVDGACSRGATHPAGTLGVLQHAHLVDHDRVLLLDDLDAVAVHETAVDRDPEGQPTVLPRRAGPTDRGDEELVDVRRPVCARVGARDDAHSRPHPDPAFSEAEVAAETCEGGLSDGDQAVGHVRRRDGARHRMARNAGDAILTQVHPDPAQRALVRWHVVRELVEKAGDGRARRTRARLVEAVRDAVDVVAEVDLDDGGFWIDRDRHTKRDAVRHAEHRVMVADAGDGALGEATEGADHPALGIAEPGSGERLQRVEAVRLDELLETPLAGARGAEGREIVAVPLFRHPNPGLAHADDVLVVLVALLHLHAGKAECALLVDVACVGGVRRWLAVAAVGLMGLRDRGQHVPALEEDRGEDRVVGVVGVAVVGIVVEERVAFADHGMEALHRLCQVLTADDVDRKALGAGQELIAGRDDRTREVARSVQERRAARPQERVRHLAHDRVEPLRQDGEQDRIEVVLELGGNIGLEPHAVMLPSRSDSCATGSREPGRPAARRSSSSPPRSRPGR